MTDKKVCEELVFLESKGFFPTDRELDFFKLMIRGANSTKAAKKLGCLHATEAGDDLYRSMRSYIELWLEQSKDLLTVAKIKLMEGMQATKYVPRTANDRGGNFIDYPTRLRYIERVHRLYGVDEPVKSKIEVSAGSDGDKDKISSPIQEALSAVYEQAGS